MGKSQNKGVIQPPKNTASSFFGLPLGTVWTGNFKESPAYKKAIADKAKADSAVAAYAKKAAVQKAAAIATAKAKKKP